MVTDLKMAFSEKSLNVKIQPCPFCGSVNNLEITSEDQFYRLYGMHGSATLVLRCTKCNAEMYEHSYHGNNYVHKANVLIKKWNKRKGKENDPAIYQQAEAL